MWWLSFLPIHLPPRDLRKLFDEGEDHAYSGFHLRLAPPVMMMTMSLMMMSPSPVNGLSLRSNQPALCQARVLVTGDDDVIVNRDPNDPS